MNLPCLSTLLVSSLYFHLYHSSISESRVSWSHRSAPRVDHAHRWTCLGDVYVLDIHENA